MPKTQLPSARDHSAEVPRILRNAATRSTIDDVTTLVAAVGGRTRATLSFRVGTADEPLHHRGINHLIGHLASAAADQDDASCHVTVSASTFSFHFSGGALAVANEIGAVCHWIGAAATRIDERSLSRARSAARSDARPHAPEHLRMLRARYGPAGWAAGSEAELGLDALGVDDVRAWVARYLTRGNAVLALSGTKATTLRVPLPPGDYVPPPQLPDSHLTLPALVPSDAPMLSLGGLLRTEAGHLDRDRAHAGLTTEIVRSRIAFALQRRYGERLRVRGGPMTLGDAAVHAVAWADVEAQQEAKVADIAVEALEMLAAEKLVAGELAAHVKRRLSAYERAAASPAGAHDLLHRQALGALNDAPWSLALERRLLTGADQERIERQAAEFSASAVLMMTETDPPIRDWHTPQPHPSFPSSGEVFRSRPAYGITSRHRRPGRLLVGGEGVTLREVGAPDAQVRWDDVAMVQRWDDGRLLLTSTRSRTLDVTPERWLAPEMVSAAVSEALGDRPVIEMGARETPAAAPTRLTDRVAPMWWWVWAGLGVALIALAAPPMWSAQLTWLRWVLGAVGAVSLLVGGAWAYDTAMTERRLRGGNRPPG